MMARRGRLAEGPNTPRRTEGTEKSTRLEQAPIMDNSEGTVNIHSWGSSGQRNEDPVIRTRATVAANSWSRARSGGQGLGEETGSSAEDGALEAWDCAVELKMTDGAKKRTVAVPSMTDELPRMRDVVTTRAVLEVVAVVELPRRMS